MPAPSDGSALDEAPHKVFKADTKLVTDLLEFDQVDTTLARLEAAHKGLWASQLAGQLNLGETCFLADRPEERDETSLLPRVDGFAHIGSTRCRLALSKI